MLWSKKKAPLGAAVSRPSSRIEVSESDKALDTVAALLRTYGKHSFDTDAFDALTLTEECENWAERLLIGDRVANDAAEEAEPDEPVAERRDWVGVRNFLRDRREVEGDYVTRSMGNLRQAIQTFAQCLTSAVADDRKTDAEVEHSVGSLSRALAARDTELIREQAGLLVTSVRGAISQRRKREEQQVQLLAERLKTLRGELTEALEQAATDPLTHLSNRAAFDEHLERLSDLGLLFGQPPSLLLFDLDHFKRVNDTYGHPAGDHVLKEVAKVLTRTFLRKQDFVARYGGEEFAVLLVDTDGVGVEMLVSRACEGLKRQPVEWQGQEIELTTSVGVAVLEPGQGTGPWLQAADRALYQAKQAGRDRVVFG